MDPRERYSSLEETIRAALDGRQVELWTAAPAIIQSFDPLSQTCTAYIATRVKLSATQFQAAKFQFQPGMFIENQDGTAWVTIPLLQDVPVVFPSGGGFTLTFPVAKEDEALVVFSSRCIDSWWSQGGIQNQNEYRLHDLSDGCAFVGIRSLPRMLTNLSTTSTQLRSDDGVTYIDVASGTITIKAGDVKVNCTTAEVTSSGKTTITASEVDLIGGGGTQKGIVQADCVCAFTGAPHAQISATVKGTI
jgi:hypothetical protein